MKKLLFAILLFARVSFAQTCDTSLLPVVFVHGFMGSGDNWALQVQRFSSNGFCEDRLFTFDWNSIGGGAGTGQRLDSFINAVLQKTGATKVNLVGHSAGGSVCYNYLSESAHAAKVARYVHVGSSRMRSPAGKKGEVPTMNIYSTDDQVMKGGGEITGAENVKQSGNDHMQVATSAGSFSAMLGFFTGEKQRDIKPVIPEPGKERFMGGKAVIMAENTPMAMDSFRVNLFDTRTGRLIKDKRAKAGGDYLGWSSFASDGSFGFNLCKACATEIEIHPAKGRRLFYYFEPLVRNNGHVYLRGLPNGGMAAAMLGNIPNDDRQAVLVIFTSNNAVIAGRDSLAIDSIPLSLPSLMPAGKTSIACFVYDDGDLKTSGQPLASLSKAPFISGADVYIKPETGRGMRVYYNGRTIVLPKRKSNEGIMVLVLN